MSSTVIKTALRRFDEFFFGPDQTRWELVRIGTALGVFLPLLLEGLSGNYERYYGHYGMIPRNESYDVLYWPAFLFLMKADPTWIWYIYWTTMASAVCLALGLWTRIAAVATFFLYVATIHRNPASFNGECGIIVYCLLSLAIAPAPQRLSIDHLILKKPLPARTEAWPARFLQFNICIMYFFTTVAKLIGDWDVGTGEIWYQITLSDWFRFSEVEWLRARWACWTIVHGSLFLEGTFAFLVWTRLRLVIVLLMMILHVLIAILFYNVLFFFNFAAISALCGFLKTTDFKRTPIGRTQEALNSA